MAKQYEDPVISTMKKAGKIPEYQQMMDYLMARRAVPEMKTRWLGTNVSGLFQPGETYAKAGTLTTNEGAGVDTLIHEITHAAEGQMKAQYAEDLDSQFSSAFKKLNPQLVMKAIAPGWTELASKYRSKSEEARAFAVENVTNPKLDPLSITRAPAHIDSTLATEFLILLDLAKRGMDKRPQSQGR
jgi:hypothetical protein